jgi:hypothetical protein
MNDEAKLRWAIDELIAIMQILSAIKDCEPLPVTAQPPKSVPLIFEIFAPFFRKMLIFSRLHF